MLKSLGFLSYKKIKQLKYLIVLKCSLQKSFLEHLALGTYG